MPEENTLNLSVKQASSKKLTEAIKLLKFLLEIDDIEIIKISLKSIIEIFEEENNSKSRE